jgi:Neuraminidase (sialidase)
LTHLRFFLALMPSLLQAAAPFLEKVEIFRAGEGGYAHYRVPAIVVSPRGTVIAVTEARKSSRGDWGPQDILMRRSRDGGRTWDAPRSIARVEGEIPPNPVALAQNLDKPGDVTYNNIVPIADHKRKILHFLFCAEYARCYAMQSGDDGDTFTNPVDITPVFDEFRREYDWKVVATGPGHGIQLRSGRLLVPVWLSNGAGGHAHRPSLVAVIYSDDHGRNWRRGDVVIRHPELKNPSETVAVELAGGRVALNIRHESPQHRRAFSYSKDGVRDWSLPEFHPQLLEPICMGSIVRYDNKRILFANPHSGEPRNPALPEGNHKRQNVSVKLSSDEGKTWPVSRSLEPGPSGYSDLAVGPDKTIYCIYERGAVSGSDTYIQSLTVARFNLEWVLE